MNILSRKICRGRVVFSGKALFSFCRAFFRNKNKKDELIEEFERSFAKYVGVKNAIAVSSGKVALYFSLRGLGARSGDEVIVPAYTVPEVIEVIILQGLHPVFVDVSCDDGTMNVDLIEARISTRTRFILATHMYGNFCQIDRILEIARKYKLEVIEDAAQACGSMYGGKKAGSFGKIGYFSFGLLKNFNTLGGGMIVSDDDELCRLIKKEVQSLREVSIRQLIKRLFTALLLWMFTHPFIFSMVIYPLLYFGLRKKKDKFESVIKSKPLTEMAMNSLMLKFSAEQAALGLLQLKTIDTLNADKINKAGLLNKLLSGIDAVRVIRSVKEGKSIYLNYVIMVQNRAMLADYLFKKGIDVGPGFVVCCAAQEEFKKFHYDCPQSLRLEKENLYLPVYRPLETADMLRIAKAIKGYYKDTTVR